MQKSIYRGVTREMLQVKRVIIRVKNGKLDWTKAVKYIHCGLCKFEMEYIADAELNWLEQSLKSFT